MIKRLLEDKIHGLLFGGKAIILMGARQTGKTTLLKVIAGDKEQVFWLNADEPEVRTIFENVGSSRLKLMFAGKKMVVIDEAQRIQDIGMKLKLITDQIPEIQVVASGSSAFELANKINEPLTGRKIELKLFPLSFKEMVDHHGWLEEKQLLSQRMIYGYYPEVVSKPEQARSILIEITESYLFKDLFSYEGIHKPGKLMKLLQALAFQIGKEVSYYELSRLAELDKETVEKYIGLLERSYILLRLPAFSRNHRKELKRGRKIYFIDNGIRNALLSNFAPLELRQDVGELWENFLVVERLKVLHYNEIWANMYFWRTQDQQEIDYIEERDGVLYAFEFKWNPKANYRFSASFTKTYPNHQLSVIHQDNVEDFLLLKE
ncbi:MAG: ATP-binding protein [Bacteroidetes bacterium]|nr:ATP-binding protein [Bacteroidota bacterium]